jgi:hypothetical protein
MRGFAAAWSFDGHRIPQAATTIKSLPKTACRMKKSIRENAVSENFPANGAAIPLVFFAACNLRRV